MLKIYVIDAKDCIYASDKIQAPSYGSGHALGSYYFDGERGKPTHHKSWIKLPKIPNEIYKMVGQPRVNYRFVLKDDLPLSKATVKKLKKEIPRTDVMYYDDADYEWEIKDKEFKLVQNFYDLVSDEQPPKKELIDFEIEKLLQIEMLPETKYKDYTVQADPNWAHKGTTDVKLDKFIKNYLVDEILLPDVMLQNKPCQISGDDLYKIVRQHIKDNIDPMVAEITSDYLFCFTVQKKIRLVKPIEKKKEIYTPKGKSYKRPRYKTIMQTSRKLEVFEMTPPSKKYGN